MANFTDYRQAELDTVAAELNGRPRKTLEYMTPSEKFAEAFGFDPPEPASALKQ